MNPIDDMFDSGIPEVRDVTVLDHAVALGPAEVPPFQIFDLRAVCRALSDQMVEENAPAELDCVARPYGSFAKVGFFRKQEDVLVEQADLLDLRHVEKHCTTADPFDLFGWFAREILSERGGPPDRRV